MKKHLFLTGEKQVGKSTLLQKLVAKQQQHGNCLTGGFYTKRTADVLPGYHTVHLLPADGSITPNMKNLLFVCCRPSPEDALRFDKLGCAALTQATTRGCSLLVMDELGIYEENAAAFKAAVLQALDGDIPILGILQKGDSPFLRAVASHPKVTVLEVTEKNRNCLFSQITQRSDQ